MIRLARIQKLLDKSRAARIQAQRFWNRLTSSQQRMALYFLAVIVTTIIAFEYAMYRLPLFIPNTAISPTVTVYILVEVGLLAVIATREHNEFKVVTAGATLFGLLLSLLTFVFANIGTGFKVLSTDVVTLDFQVATGMLLFAIELCAIGILFPKVQSLPSNS